MDEITLDESDASISSCALNSSQTETDPDLVSNESCNLYDFIVEAVLMGSLCLFGFIGNSLSTVCLWQDRSKTATPFLLVSLEIADTSFLITVVILRVLDSIQTFSDTLPFMDEWTPYLGKYLYPCAISAETGTIYLTILVTVNRYVSVCKPYDVTDRCSLRHARRHVIVVWLCSVAFNAPRFFEYDVIEENICDDGSLSPNLKPSTLLASTLYQILYLNVLYFLVMFLVPLVTLVILNYRLIAALRRTRRRRESMRGGGSGGGGGGASVARSEDDITLMLIVVVLIFVVSQSPALVTHTLGLFKDHFPRGCPNHIFYYERISDLLIVANSSLNFVVYCFCSRRFRQILVKVVCRRQGASRGASRGASQGTRAVKGGQQPGQSRRPGATVEVAASCAAGGGVEMRLMRGKMGALPGDGGGGKRGGGNGVWTEMGTLNGERGSNVGNYV